MRFLASVATLVQLIAVTAIADVRVAKNLVPAALAGSLVLAAEAVWLARRKQPPPSSSEPDEEQEEGQGAAPQIDRPFALTPALVLAGVLSVGTATAAALSALAVNTVVKMVLPWTRAARVSRVCMRRS